MQLTEEQADCVNYFRNGFYFAFLVAKAMGENFTKTEALKSFIQELAEGKATLQDSPADEIAALESAHGRKFDDSLRQELFGIIGEHTSKKLHNSSAKLILPILDKFVGK